MSRVRSSRVVTAIPSYPPPVFIRRTRRSHSPGQEQDKRFGETLRKRTPSPPLSLLHTHTQYICPHTHTPPTHTRELCTCTCTPALPSRPGACIDPSRRISRPAHPHYRYASARSRPANVTRTTHGSPSHPTNDTTHRDKRPQHITRVWAGLPLPPPKRLRLRLAARAIMMEDKYVLGAAGEARRGR